MAVEQPRLAETLMPYLGDLLEDGDTVEDVLWADDQPVWPQELQIAGSQLRGLRLTGQEIDDLTLLDTVVEGSELSGVVVAGWRCERVAFSDCRMAGLVATDLRARHVRFVGCQLQEAWFRGASFDHCELVDCDLTGADLSRARLASTSLLSCRLDGVDLADARTDEVALHGSSLDGVKGISALRNLVIGTDQVVELAIPLLASHGIQVDDDWVRR